MTEEKKMRSKEAILKSFSSTIEFYQEGLGSIDRDVTAASIRILHDDIRALVEVLVDIRDVLDELKEIERAKALQAIRR